MGMLDIMFMVLSVIGAGLTLMIVYGAILKRRSIILTGLMFYSFLPIIGETVGMLTRKEPYHILFIGMFVVQLLITTINRVPFDEKDKTLMEYAKRMGGALIIINLVSAIFILLIVDTYPIHIGAFHGIITLSLLYGIVQRLTGKMTH
ncbi:MAG: hypothetical protein CMP39_03240 [Rickettsiales bacterium]|nr:hypothetical protein [Rickettsiales bacterium]